VPSNIAEGHERDSIQDFIRFLRISKGSNGELRTQAYIASKLGLIDPEHSRQIVSESKEISAMLQGLIRSIQQRKSITEN
jgi:four helix bundle protein